MKKVSILCLFFLSACGGGSSNSLPETNNDKFDIFLSGLNSNGYSFDQQNISISSTDINCSYNLNSSDLIHLENDGNNNFSFKNPIIYESSEVFNFVVTTVPQSDCRNASKSFSITVNKFPTEYELICKQIRSCNRFLPS